MAEKIDRPFFEKFNKHNVYFNSQEEYYLSIVNEIGNILSSRLKISDIEINNVGGLADIPFIYGIRDIHSVNTLNTDEFKAQCRDLVMMFEPRITDFEITSITHNQEIQSLELTVRCVIKKNNKTISTTIKVK